jgi:hypothetical protein
VKQIGLFIQDDWQVNDHLQLNIGLRWDYEKNPSYLDFVTAGVVDAVRAGSACRRWPELRRYAGAERPEHQRLHQQRPQPQGIQECPRLGFSYDINADEQHVIHGGAGRSRPRPVRQPAAETTKLALPQPTIYFRNPATGQCFQGNAACYDWNPNLLNGIGNLQTLVGATSNAGLKSTC